MMRSRSLELEGYSMLAKLSVWMFVALIMLVDGLVILLNGLYNWHHDGVPAVAVYHPSVVWGAVMMLFGVLVLWLDRRSWRKRK